MSIADYTDLLVQVSDYTARDDFAQNFPRFVSYTENKLNRRLRVAQMEIIDSIITDTDGAATLPTDYLEMREVMNASGVLLELSPVKALDEYFGPYSGTSARYSIVNNAFFAVPKSSHEFTITYYGKIPALTATIFQKRIRGSDISGCKFFCINRPDSFYFMNICHNENENFEVNIVDQSDP